MGGGVDERITQEWGVRSSRIYDGDPASLPAVRSLVTNRWQMQNLQNDLNVIRALLCEVKGTPNWYDVYSRAPAHFLGTYADEAAIIAAHPTANSGDTANNLDTGTMWYWDGAAWADSTIATTGGLTGPAASTARHVAIFFDASGNVIADGGIPYPVRSGRVPLGNTDFSDFEHILVPVGKKLLFIGGGVSLVGGGDATDIKLQILNVTDATTIVETNGVGGEDYTNKEAVAGKYVAFRLINETGVVATVEACAWVSALLVDVAP